MAKITHDLDQKTVQDLVNLYQHGQLDLAPGFQRKSVWKKNDRANLMDSIVRNYPLPAIFLHRRHDNGNIIYSVIDGKQRIESIFMFMGVIRGNRYDAKLHFPDHEEPDYYDWRDIKKRGLQHYITGYKLRAIEVDGEVGDIIDLFVRINSTGKALTRAEQRHAKYYSSQFMKAASSLASRYQTYFSQMQILSSSQISRMKHVELICELMISLHANDVINKKAVLDKVMEAKSLNGREVQKARDKVIKSLNLVKKMFPQLNQTRFHQLADFYTLTVLISKFDVSRLVLNDSRRNRLAWDILVAFSTGVDKLREEQKRAKSPRGMELQREYLLTVLRGTDEIGQRRRREEILRGLLESLFLRKDSQRTFSSEQRRILWNSSASRKCQARGCNKILTWADFTIDHINPHTKGGQTKLANAALLCKSCNSKKGGR